MRRQSKCGLLAVLTLALAASPAGATTLRRTGLDELVSTNGTIVVGKIVGMRSRWNDQRNFILTEITIAPNEVLKGEPRSGLLTVTLMGGSVDGLTTLIVGGPRFALGKSYLVFLNKEHLPGTPDKLTVRDLCQGAFDIAEDETGTRAISQASDHPLLPDARGETHAPGGARGLPLAELSQTIRALVARGTR